MLTLSLIRLTLFSVHLPRVEGVTRPSLGAASAFLALALAVFFIFPLQFSLPMRLFYQIGSPRQNVVTAIRQDKKSQSRSDPFPGHGMFGDEFGHGFGLSRK